MSSQEQDSQEDPNTQMKGVALRAFGLASGMSTGVIVSVICLGMYAASPAASILWLIGGIALGIGAIGSLFELATMDMNPPKITKAPAPGNDKPAPMP